MGDELEPETMRKLFVGGISYDTRDEDLKEFFSQFGSLTDCIVMRDPVPKGQQGPGRSRGFGFVTFKTRDQLEQAMEYKLRHGHRICNRDVDTKRAVSKSVGKANQLSYLSTKKIHVSNLPVENVCNEDLRRIFDRFGEIVDIDVKYRDAEKKESRRFGFVEFKDQDSVDKTMKEQESMAEEKPRRTFMLGNQSLEVKKAFSKSVLEQMKNKEMSGPSMRNGYGRMGGGMRNDSGPPMGNYGDMYNDRMSGPQNNYGGYGGFNQNAGGRGYGMDSYSQPQQQYGGYGQPPQQQGFYGGSGFPQQPQPYTGGYSGDFGQNYNSGASNYGPMRSNFSSQQRSASGPYPSSDSYSGPQGGYSSGGQSGYSGGGQSGYSSGAQSGYSGSQTNMGSSGTGRRY